MRRWEPTVAERQAVLASRHPASTLVLVILLLTFLAVLAGTL